MIGDALATVNDDDNTDTTISVTSEESVDSQNEQNQDDMSMREEFEKFNAEFKAYLKKENLNSNSNSIKDKITIIEDDYINKEEVKIKSDVYNLTIGVNMTKALPPNQIIYCI